jgi:hypothetical protein
MAKKNTSLSRPLVNLTANPGTNQDSTKKITNTGQKPADKTIPPVASKQK